jgi:hypothetical protein
MKTFSYFLLAVSLLLLIACPGEFDDSQKTILDQQLKGVLSPEMMKTIKGIGTPTSLEAGVINLTLAIIKRTY